jgi:hypothetical protein
MPFTWTYRAVNRVDLRMVDERLLLTVWDVLTGWNTGGPPAYQQYWVGATIGNGVSTNRLRSLDVISVEESDALGAAIGGVLLAPSLRFLMEAENTAGQRLWGEFLLSPMGRPSFGNSWSFAASWNLGPPYEPIVEVTSERNEGE